MHTSLYLLYFGDVTYAQSLLASQMKSLSSTDWCLWLLGSCIGKGAITEFFSGQQVKTPPLSGSFQIAVGG